MRALTKILKIRGMFRFKTCLALKINKYILNGQSHSPGRKVWMPLQSKLCSTWHFSHLQSFPPSLTHQSDDMERATAQVRRWQNNFCTKMGRWRQAVTKHERRGGGKGGRRWYEATVESGDWDYSGGDRGVAAGNVFADWRAVVEAVLFHALYVDVSSAQLRSRTVNQRSDTGCFHYSLFCYCNAGFFYVVLRCTFNLQLVTAEVRHMFPFCGNGQTSYVQHKFSIKRVWISRDYEEKIINFWLWLAWLVFWTSQCRSWAWTINYTGFEMKNVLPHCRAPHSLLWSHESN